MKEKLTVVKVGGKIVEDEASLHRLIRSFSALSGHKVLVHGGGRTATDVAARLGLATQMVNGRRVTDADMLRVVTMVYGGLVNKNVVARLAAQGICALGLTGADGNAIRATRRKPEPIDYGFVGDIAPEGVNASLIGSLLDAGVTPVFCAITHDGNGSLLNCNADTIASAVATGTASLSPVELIYCFEQPGVMEDIERPDSVIPLITPDIYKRLRAEGVVSKGMIPKIDNAFAAIDAGVRSVTIKHSDALNRTSGTVIRD